MGRIKDDGTQISKSSFTNLASTTSITGNQCLHKLSLGISQYFLYPHLTFEGELLILFTTTLYSFKIVCTTALDSKSLSYHIL